MRCPRFLNHAAYALLTFAAFIPASITPSWALEKELPLRLKWEKNYLSITGDHLPGKELVVHYLEAYCRDGSADADWVQHTVVGHRTELIEASPDGTRIHLRDHVRDGIVVDHEIRSTSNEVLFQIKASNPTLARSEAHWAQPCIRLANFTGADQETYLKKSFVFIDGQLQRMPTTSWATRARYVPGQVWCPLGVNRNDVNPRPLNPRVPTNGLIGCFSADESRVFGTAFEPYQELFQGVIVCLHSDFRLGGLMPGESKEIKGRIYIAENIPELLERYERDFPEHLETKP